MTLRDLKRLIDSQPSENLDLQLLIWLPGSHVALHGNSFIAGDGNTIMLEGYLEPGSALELL